MSSRGISSYTDDNKTRFQTELEFVQCLANPKYLNYLAQRGTFREPAFINYLKYLLYWKEPEYAKFLKYPQCLYILDLLQYESFRTELTDVRCCKFIEDQQLLHWKHYQFIRTKLENEHLEQTENARQPLQSQNQNAVASQPPQQSTMNPNLFLK